MQICIHVPRYVYDCVDEGVCESSYIWISLQIVWGFYIGCYHEDIHVEEAMAYSEKAKSLGLAGVMVWSVNKDTNHRFEHLYDGDCGRYQTGLPDGTYHTAIGQVMHSD